MDSHDAANWQMASWSNGNPFANTWQADNVSFNNGLMTLTLDNNGCPKSCDNKPYASGEYRTMQEIFSQGYYEARIKFAEGNGLVSGTFFTYRGTYGKLDHDEVDIEALGKDCAKIQTNYYVEGKGGHEEMISLGFNGCKDFHNYGFKLSGQDLTWFIDGKAVRTVTASPAIKLPYRPAKIMANFWAGTSEVKGWLNGPFKYVKPLDVQYDWIRYSTLTGSEAKP